MKVWSGKFETWYFCVLLELKMSVNGLVVSCLIISTHVGQVSPFQKSAISPPPTQHTSDHSHAVQRLVDSV